jgi:hypothetical protein
VTYLDGQINEVVVRDAAGPGPHPGIGTGKQRVPLRKSRRHYPPRFMLIPVVVRLDDFLLDGHDMSEIQMLRTPTLLISLLLLTLTFTVFIVTPGYILRQKGCKHMVQTYIYRSQITDIL